MNRQSFKRHCWIFFMSKWWRRPFKMNFTTLYRALQILTIIISVTVITELKAAWLCARVYVSFPTTQLPFSSGISEDICGERSFPVSRRQQYPALANRAFYFSNSGRNNSWDKKQKIDAGVPSVPPCRRSFQGKRTNKAILTCFPKWLLSTFIFPFLSPLHPLPAWYHEQVF